MALGRRVWSLLQYVIDLLDRAMRTSLLLVALSLPAASGFLAPGQPSSSKESCLQAKAVDRRAMLAALTVSVVPSIASADTGAEVRGTPITPFNSLMFQYRGTENSGLKATDIVDEPSVPYMEFLEKLSVGDVEFVEFMAPAGDSAYVTFKGKSPIRIGEGYPVEDPMGWSSPSFVVRAVKNKGVPYKFTVPALQKFQTS